MLPTETAVMTTEAAVISGHGLLPLWRRRVVAAHALVDLDLLDELAKLRWALLSTGYAAYSTHKAGKQVSSYLHRVVMSAEPKQIVDHIDRDKLNNTRANLRLVTQAENTRNQGMRRNNTSGFRGVTRVPTGWRAEFSGRNYGTHLTPEAAARAYDAAVRSVGDPYAYLNFPGEGSHLKTALQRLHPASAP